MRHVIKPVLAAIAAIGLLTQPQQASAAEGDDIARALVGIATLAIIAKAVDDRKDRKKKATTQRWRAEQTQGAARFGSRDNRRIIDGRVLPFGEKPRAGKRGYKKHALPRQCLRTVETRRGNRPAYAARCLDRTYKFARRLPQSCEALIRTRRGVQAVYGARCLQRDGWNVARR